MLIKIFAVLMFLPFLHSCHIHCRAAETQNQPATNEMLASMLMFGFRGTGIDAQNGVPNLPKGNLPFNYILFDRDVSGNTERNIASPEQLRRLTGALQQISPETVFIAVDQEGGQVRRLKPQKGFADLESAQKMGQENVSSTLAKAEALGRELADLGINVDLAPVVDVDTNPYNPLVGRLGRAFSSDQTLVAAHGLAFGQGLARNRVIPVLKHFPGQGCADKDNHLEPTNISQCWNADIDLLPYAEIFSTGWPGMVMMGHLALDQLDPNLPASLSANMVTGLLRQGMGWQGVIMTDDLQMKSVSGQRGLKETISLAIKAGNDLLLFGNNLEWDENLPQKVWDSLQELIAEGEITEERIKQSWLRIQALKNAYFQQKMDNPPAE